MTEEMKKIVCPNCGAQAIKEGTKIVCDSCDATFSFKKTGGAKVVEIGRLEAAEKRLDRLDALFPGESNTHGPGLILDDDDEIDNPVLGPA